MTFEQIDRAAYANQPPEVMNTIERRCYEIMRCMYWRFEHGDLDRELARSQKPRVRTAYEHDMMMYRMFCACSDRERRIRTIASDIEKHGTEGEKRIIRILDGRETT